MKKWVIATLVAVVAALAVVIIVTGRKEPQKENLTADVTKVAVIMNGEPDDMGWTQAHYEAFEGVREELNLDISYRFSVSAADEEEIHSVFDGIMTENPKIVFTNSYDFVDIVREYSEKYPETCFCSCAGNYTADNVATFFGRIYQMRYLSGIVAGMTTATDHIGYVAAVPIPEVIRGINAFTLGVQSVNPDAVVHVNWTGDWLDEEKAYDKTNELLDSFPIDVMTQHHDSLKPIIAAKEREVYSIGYNVDQSSVSEYYLTAPVWNWKPVIKELVLNVLKDSFEGRNYWEGIESDTVSLAEFSDLVSAETAAAVDSAAKRMLEGDWDVFYGPIYSQDGELRIKEGEMMSDRQLLESFDWFVKGVDGSTSVS